MAPVRIAIGSIWFWLICRLSAASILIIAPVLAPNLRGLRGLEARFLFLLIIFAIVVFLGEELAYGYATEEGIHYRRYFLERYVPWRKISAIRWSASGRITVEFRQRLFFLRKNLWMQDFRSDSPSASSSQPPNAVRWLLRAKPEGSGRILLEGPGI